MAEEVRDVDFEMPRDPVSVGRARTWFWRGSWADAGWSREMKSRLVDLEVGWLSRVVWKVRCAQTTRPCAQERFRRTRARATLVLVYGNFALA